jgi:hypothetical protein
MKLTGYIIAVILFCLNIHFLSGQNDVYNKKLNLDSIRSIVHSGPNVIDSNTLQHPEDTLRLHLPFRNISTLKIPGLLIYPAYNDNDGWLAGVLLTNSNYDKKKKVSFAIAPMYSFTNKKILGQSWVNYDFLLNHKTVNSLTFRAGIKSFDMFTNQKLNYSLRYIKIDPSIKIWFNHRHEKGKVSSLMLKAYFIDEEMAELASATELKGIDHIRSTIFKLEYDIQKRKMSGTSDFKISAEQQSYSNENYIKLSTIGNQSWMYKPKKNFYFRIFASGFISNSQRKSINYQNIFTRGTISLIQQGFNDYTYDEYFFARQNQTKFYDDQVSISSGGGFKTPVGSANAIGMSNNFAGAINTSVDLPFSTSWLPLRVYFDLGTYSTFGGGKFNNNWMYNGGLSLNYKDIFAIHCPLIFSDNLGDVYKASHKDFFSRLSFTIDLHKLNFWDRKIVL